MASLHRVYPQRIRAEIGERARFRLDFLLADRQVEARLAVPASKPPRFEFVDDIVFHAAALDARDGPLKLIIGQLNVDLSLGDFVEQHTKAAVAAALTECNDTSASWTLHVARHIELAPADLGVPSRDWDIDPPLPLSDPIMAQRYLLVRIPQESDSARHVIGWLPHSEKGEHRNILQRYSGGQPLGGGLLTLAYNLGLQNRSGSFGFAPFPEVLDAAKAVLQAAQSTRSFSSVVVQGAIDIEFSRT